MSDQRDIKKYKEALGKTMQYSTSIENAATGQSGEGKLVAVAPPETETGGVKLVTEEVHYQDFVKGDAQIIKDMVDYTNEIKSMIGSTADVVGEYLVMLKEKKAIIDFKIIPIGGLTTLEQQAGVVTVIKDATNMVVDIEIS